ncbi:MAG: methyltransferase domain-containing protein [Planctomycetes bacterium]|nr:methyltransferase domain-containing protein [Planctomycetota bacterium]
MPQPIIAEGDIVVLWTSDNRARTVHVRRHDVFSTHLGELALEELIGRPYGWRFDLSSGWGLAILPSLEDRIHLVRRSTNILYPKDIGLILLKIPIGPGCRVVEIGTGAGAMTVALGDAVSPGGVVHTFDVREDHLTAAKRNVRRSGIQAEIHFALREPGTPLPVEPVDCVILDIPQPWLEIEVVNQILRPGGRLAAMNPTYNQIEQMAAALERTGYVLIESIEVIFRRIVAVPGRVRPSRVAIPHTEFLLFGVRTAVVIPPESVDQHYPER